MPRKELPSIYDIGKFIKPDKLLPIYFFCGEDGYTIDSAVKAVEKACLPLVKNEFDREVINLDKTILFSSVIDLGLGFPFGDGKKVIIVKNFETVKDKGLLREYALKPADFTIMIITNPAKISDFEKEPYATLYEKGYIFEARELKFDDLVSWLVKHAKRNKLVLSADNARALVEIVGEDKGLLEMHIQKFYDFLGDGGEVTFDIVKKLSSSTKEYSIFDLQDAISANNKAKAIEIGYNLLDCGVEIVQIIGMLAKYIKTIAQSIDFVKENTNQFQAAKTLKISYQYYLGCIKARNFMNQTALIRAADALLSADVAVKTTAMEHKTVLLILIAGMLGETRP